ncbi:MAG: hypothetical protein KC619_33300 [Myxococcales bacterium]|nr:hypothetical protein [Myxococcales bacterium]
MRHLPLPFAALALLFTTPALAQEAEPPPEYEARIQEALTESANGNWADARAAFRQAHESFPNARTERGIGMVSFELRDYVDSVRHLRAALAHSVRPLTEAQRVETQALLDRAIGRVAIFSLTEVPEGAEITVDGRAVEPEEDGTLMLAIGQHEVVVTGAHRWASTLPVRGGETGPLPMRFEEPEVQAPPDPTPPPRVEPPPPERVAPPGAMALTIGGAVGFLVGVAVLVAGIAEYYTVQNAPADPTNRTEWAELSGPYAITQPLQGVGYAVMGVGAALTIGGAIWLTQGEEAPRPSALLRLGGTF